jgi:prevent-host-death family protein
MTTVTIHEAKTHLSRLINRVLAGEEIVVARGREPVIKLVPAKPATAGRRVPGRYAHLRPPGSKGILESGFWEPLSDEEMGLGEDPILDRRR